jgi:hypothetical protein
MLAGAKGQASADAFNSALGVSASKKMIKRTNVQTFTGSLGGAAPAVEESEGDRPFSVNGATFVNEAAAIQRSCAIQNNTCANAINSGSVEGSVSECGTQEAACLAAS